MKKIIISLLAVLFIAGTVYAAGIPTAVSPKTSPEVWTVEVYNNYTSALTSGTAVVWDCASDTTDASFAYRTMWVTTTTTNDDINFAGIVVDSSIPAATEGTIAIWGPVYALVADSTDAVTADHLVGTANGVRGQLGDGDSADNTATAGWCIYAAGVAVAYGGYGSTDGVDNIMIPVFIDKGYMSEGTD